MTKSSLAQKTLPLGLQKGFKQFGEHIVIARKRRRMSRKDLAARMYVSLDTLQRIERGDPTVGAGIFFTALWVLGHQRLLKSLFRRKRTGPA